MDPKIVLVALSGLENILKTGESEKKDDLNQYSVMIEECYGLDKIEFLQSHENMEIYHKAFKMVETYFGSDGDDSDARVNPQMTADQFQFNVNPQEPQIGANPGGFQF